MKSVCGAALLMLASLAGPALAQGNDPVVAQRGSVTLTASGVRTLLGNLDADTRARVQGDAQALGALVRDRLLQGALFQEQHAQQWDQRPEVAARAEQARQAAIVESYLASVTQPDSTYPSDDEIQSAYEANKAKLMVPRQYHIAHIYLAVPPNAPKAADDDARNKLADARAQISRGKADFASVARRLSDDKRTTAEGGDIGWVREDTLLPALRTVLSGLSDGGVSDPVKTGDGWQLLRVLGTRPAAPAPLSDAREALVRALRQQRQQQNVRAYVDKLLQQQPVQLNEIELGKLVLK